ncbi:AraC family transcriptional regulator ligand-binding domain-containing protein [Algiphilus sp.]|uniref:AraC family transcriptional regulator n=1 Tax=Algiphilus sp. TaxID=1872431 RepID=UPI003BA9654E
MTARDLPQLLSGTSLTADRLIDDGTYLSGEEQIRILENALSLSGDPELGLRVGCRLTPAAHGPMGFLASSSPHLLAALYAFQSFLPTRVSFARLTLCQTRTEVQLHAYFDAEMRPDVSRCVAETCATAFFACAEFIIGRPAHEVETCFSHPNPGAHSRYREVLPGRVVFSSKQMVLRIPRSVCDIPNASANRESYRLAQQQCEALLAELRRSPDSLRRQVETVMLSHPGSALSEEAAAAALFITKRTLARRLKAEGTGFRQIRDDVLARQARHHLIANRLSVDAIAALLNYHDSANFRRAFKRWFGVSPDQYRNEHGR